MSVMRGLFISRPCDGQVYVAHRSSRFAKILLCYRIVIRLQRWHCRRALYSAPTRWAAYALGVTLGVVPASGQSFSFLSGNQLAEVCLSNTPSDRGVCRGYVMGILDTFDMGLPLNCDFPRGINTTQVTDIVINYLRAHPKNAI